MKTFTIVLMALTLSLPARADGDNWIQNGDFSDGISHWYGGGRSPADFASDNPLQQSDPFTSKGLIIPLKAADWIKVAQDSKAKVASVLLTITYQISKDFAFSTKPEDYVNMPDKIGYDGWQPFNSTPGAWVVCVSDFGTGEMAYRFITPKTGTSEPQTFRAAITDLTPNVDKTVTLAFPPGSGTLVVLSVSMTSK